MSIATKPRASRIVRSILASSDDWLRGSRRTSRSIRWWPTGLAARPCRNEPAQVLGPDETTGCVRLRVRRAPGGELLVFREHGLDQLVDEVVGVLVDERGVRVQLSWFSWSRRVP